MATKRKITLEFEYTDKYATENGFVRYYLDDSESTVAVGSKSQVRILSDEPVGITEPGAGVNRVRVFNTETGEAVRDFLRVNGRDLWESVPVGKTGQGARSSYSRRWDVQVDPENGYGESRFFLRPVVLEETLGDVL